MVDQYIFSGSLPENASTYVTRDADRDLYDGLRSGKFCYVLNSRQSGKSSLRVRTMRRLRENGVECAAIDLSAGGIQNVPPEQWYADLIDSLIDIFDLDVDFEEWWGANQLNSLVTRFRKFLEEILLVEVKENIVIFIDEIDSVLSLNFPTDDFFAFIRSCYNQRVDNPAYNRLTFCLLGVASPSNLIQDKQRTPFNIGKAISLKGFQIHEVEPLEKGLKGKFNEPQAVIKEILDWTKGQPFLTQKLCQFMVEESEKENPRTVEEVVKSKIIESWESQDEPEHLRTIRAKILRNEERAGYLLDLYQQVRHSEVESEITADNTLEQSELLLSGLVARREDKLRVYNLIYKQVFSGNWVENELKNLRPYSESFKFWVASKGKDESRLLRGKALADAEEWEKDKNLSYQDKQFLAASRAKQIQGKIAADEQAAKLERERKDKEAAEKINLVLSETKQKVEKQLKDIQELLEIVEKLSLMAIKLKNEGSNSEAEELFLLAGQSFNIQDYKLRLAILNAGISYAYQMLKSKDLKQAQKYLKESQKEFHYLQNNSDNVVLQISIFTLKIEANLFKEQGNLTQEINSYKKAYEILNFIKNKAKRGNRTVDRISPPFQNLPIKILSKQYLEAFHREFINLLSKQEEKNHKNEVKESLKEHYLDELNNLLANKEWEEADRKTSQIMLFIADREKKYLNIEDIEIFPCIDLKEIDRLWVDNSNGNFGFSVQAQIWKDIGGNQLNINWSEKDYEKYLRFETRLGWHDSSSNFNLLNYKDVINKVNKGFLSPRGILPFYNNQLFNQENKYLQCRRVQSKRIYQNPVINFKFPLILFSRVAACEF